MCLIGENPFNIELLWQRMYGERHDFRHPSLYATPVISALEMALWDIVGKAAGSADLQPVGREVPREVAGVCLHAAAGGRVHGESGGCGSDRGEAAGGG